MKPFQLFILYSVYINLNASTQVFVFTIFVNNYFVMFIIFKRTIISIFHYQRMSCLLLLCYLEHRILSLTPLHNYFVMSIIFKRPIITLLYCLFFSFFFSFILFYFVTFLPVINCPKSILLHKGCFVIKIMNDINFHL